MMDMSSFTHAVASQGLNPVTSASAPSNLVTERFTAMMSAAPPSVPAVTDFPAAPLAHGPVSSAQHGQSLGSQILAGLQSASANYSQHWRNLSVGLDQMVRHPSAANMLKVQSELLQASVQYELVGKAVSRSTQNIDTLVRMS